MADSVQYHLERMVPELEDLEQKGVFTKAEIKAIVKRRTAFEYAVHRLSPTRSDYLRYISYETNLERLRRKRKRRLRLDRAPDKKKGEKGMTLSDYSILRRIHGLYSKMLARFPGDVEVWKQYFQWGRAAKSGKTLGKSFARAIQLHPTKPTFWILASAWEFEENNNVNSARTLLQRGIRINRDNQLLWHEYFKLELLYTEKLKERRRVM
ncbi:U3 small nucleolar RNA-associated protein 6-domain-containing protein, partial [Blyttiomyces helicus]